MPSKKIKIALSFDDAPTVDSGLLSGEERSKKILSAFDSNNIKEAAFFCNTKKEQKIEQLQKYVNAGHIIGNHTSTHPDLTKVSVENFIEAIGEADKILTQFSTYNRIFRFPYLREDHRQLKKNQEVKSYLQENSYSFGYITIESFDWYVDEIFQSAKSNINFEKFYTSILLETIEDGCAIAKEALGTQPAHILLLHENDVNAFFLSSLIQEARKKGYEFIPLSDALKDPIADKNWDLLPQSMRRIESIAKKKKISLTKKYRWLDTENILQEFKKYCSDSS